MYNWNSFLNMTCADPGGQFLSKSGPDHLVNHKAAKPAFNGGPMMACFKWCVDPLSPQQKIRCQALPPLMKLSGSAFACFVVSIHKIVS